MAETLLQLGWSDAADAVHVRSGARVLRSEAALLDLSLAPGVVAVLDCAHPARVRVTLSEPNATAQAAPLPLAVLCTEPGMSPRHAVMTDGRIRSVTRLLEGATGFPPALRIATPDGGRAAGSLRPGDTVLTRDNGFQPVLWTGRVRITPDRYGALFPVAAMRILANGAGPGQPATEIALPPRHRVLVADSRAALHFEEREVLVAAQDLTVLGSAVPGPGQTLDLVQILLPRHQVILAEGLWCETLQATPERLTLLPPLARRQVLSHVRDAAEQGDGSARLMLTRAEVGLLRVGI